MPRKQQSAEENDGAHEMGLEGASTTDGAVGAPTKDGGGPTGMMCLHYTALSTLSLH